MSFPELIEWLNNLVWGPAMLALLVGTGIFLTCRTKFLLWRNLGYSIRSVLSREAHSKSGGAGDVSPFSALMTALASTIGTGNIVGVATALVSGGPGALVWMEISAAFGISSKFSECMLAVKYREVNSAGEMSGGPMYTMKNGIRNRKAGAVLAFLFAAFTMVASLGLGDMTQSHSIAEALHGTFAVPHWITGAVVTVLSLVIVIGGIKSISRVSSVVVPIMALFYLAAGLIVILGNIQEVPAALVTMFQMAFSPKAAAGGVAGTITASVLTAAHFGVARGCFSNEAGLGSAAISAACAKTDQPVRQGYISMTGTFFDTLVVCTITGLCICSSGVLGTVDPVTGKLVDGSALTILAFETVLGPAAKYFITIGIMLFAFSTILGWEYNGEKSFEYLFGRKPVLLYRVFFCLIAFVGATQPLELVWGISDIFNALMAIPNLICLLLLSGTVARELDAFQPQVKLQKEAWRAQRKQRRT